MKTMLWTAALVTACACGTIREAQAGGKERWEKIAELTAGGDAKEVAASGWVRKCRIRCVEGSVAINTLVVREGAKKTSITVAARVAEGEEKDIELENEAQVSGFRISDGGKGRYELLVAMGHGERKKSEGRDGDWKAVGEFDAEEGAREISFSGRASACRIEWVSGAFAINTVVVRAGAAKETHTVATHFENGTVREISLANPTDITGFRLSQEGRGKYRLLVR